MGADSVIQIPINPWNGVRLVCNLTFHLSYKDSYKLVPYARESFSVLKWKLWNSHNPIWLLFR